MYGLALGFVVERLWSDVEISGPHERAELSIDLYLRKDRGIAQRRKHALPILAGEVDVTDGSILERQAQTLRANHLDSYDVRK